MRLPRDVSGDDLAKALAELGYRVTRQTGSHLRLTTAEHGEHHITIPRHESLRVDTLAEVLIWHLRATHTFAMSMRAEIRMTKTLAGRNGGHDHR